MPPTRLWWTPRDSLEHNLTSILFPPLTILFDESGRPVRGPKGISIDKESDRAEIARWIEEGTLEDSLSALDAEVFYPAGKNSFSGCCPDVEPWRD